MDEEKKQEVQQWLTKSEHDLQAAQLLFDSQASLLDVVVYHCQQAVEKALKGYLTYQDLTFQKTHNLSVLLGSCIAFNQNFSDFYEVAETLTPYATEFRYPNDIIEPEREEAEQAIAMADTVVKFVIETIRYS